MTTTRANVKVRGRQLNAAEEWNLRYDYNNIFEFWMNRFKLILAGRNPFWDNSAMMRTVVWNLILLAPIVMSQHNRFSAVAKAFAGEPNGMAYVIGGWIFLVLSWVKYLLGWNAAYNGLKWITYREEDTDDWTIRKRYKALFFGQLLLWFLL